VDTEIWKQDGIFNVFFNLTSSSGNDSESNDTNATPSPAPVPTMAAQSRTNPPPAGNKMTLNLISAKLRLYKMGEEGDNKVGIISSMLFYGRVDV
jgi:hypothetical protein